MEFAVALHQLINFSKLLATSHHSNHL